MKVREVAPAEQKGGYDIDIIALLVEKAVYAWQGYMNICPFPSWYDLPTW